MSYIGNQPVYQAFVTDQFSGNGSTTAFTMSVAPANTASVLVAVSGVLQDPSTYSVSGTTLTFSAAPPSGTGNISARYLGIPASGVTTTAYRTVTEFTATAGQTTFTPPSYTAGYINVYRNGTLLGSADYTATNGTTVVLASGATAGDLVTVESFYVSSVVGAIPATAGAVTDTYILTMAGSKLTGTQSIPSLTLPAGTVLQVVNATTATPTSTSSTTFQQSNLTASITPKSATSKVLILCSFSVYYTSTASSSYSFHTLYRNNTTNLGGANVPGLCTMACGAGATLDLQANIMFVDSPATTSSTSYTQWFKAGGSSTIITNDNNCTNSIILMEIAA